MSDKRRGVGEIRKRARELGLETDPVEKTKGTDSSEWLKIHQGAVKRRKVGGGVEEITSESSTTKRGAAGMSGKTGRVQGKGEIEVRGGEKETWLDNWVKTYEGVKGIPGVKAHLERKNKGRCKKTVCLYSPKSLDPTPLLTKYFNFSDKEMLDYFLCLPQVRLSGTVEINR